MIVREPFVQAQRSLISDKSLPARGVGSKEMHDDIQLVSFMDYDLGNFNLENRELEPIENPFGPKLSPMWPGHSVAMSPGQNLAIIWRRGRDSNPRYPFEYAGFQDRSHQPLGHLSMYPRALFRLYGQSRHFYQRGPIYRTQVGPRLFCWNIRHSFEEPASATSSGKEGQIWMSSAKTLSGAVPRATAVLPPYLR